MYELSVKRIRSAYAKTLLGMKNKIKVSIYTLILLARPYLRYLRYMREVPVLLKLTGKVLYNQ